MTRGHLSQLDCPHSDRVVIGMQKVTVIVLFRKVLYILLIDSAKMLGHKRNTYKLINTILAKTNTSG